MMKIKLFLLLAAVLVMVLLNSSTAQDEDTAIVHVGDAAPDFSFQPVGGKVTSIKDLKGKVILINLFATWCPPCNKEMPSLQKDIYEAINDGNFTMFAVGREHKETELKQFAEKKKITFPLVPDPDKKIFALFAKQSIPRSFVIGKDGKIIFALFGYDEEGFSKMIEAIKTELKK